MHSLSQTRADLTPNLAKPNRQNFSWTVFLVAIIALVVFIRLRLLNMPLERDEGEFAYMGQLMLQGIPPYKLAYNMKLPGVYAAYAGIMAVLGQSITGIHLGFLLVNLACLFLLFFVARTWFGFKGAVVAVTSYALISASPGVLGLQGHATHLVSLFALVGIFLWQRSQRSPNPVLIFLTGLAFGLSFLSKQPGLFLAFFGGAMVLRDAARARPFAWLSLMARLGLFVAGFLLPFAVTCLCLWRAGVFPRFWFWVFTCTKVHAGLLTPESIVDTWRDFYRDTGAVRLWWIPGVIGLIELFVRPDQNDRRFPLLALFGFSLLAFCGGFYLTTHYFIALLPAFCLLIALAFDSAEEVLSRLPWVPCCVPLALYAAACLWFVGCERLVWFRLSPEAACQFIYWGNPFPESPAIGEFIRGHTTPEQTIAVFGSEPQIYFYARRHSATGYIYMYDLVQLQPYADAMQKEMTRQVGAARPAFVVAVNIKTSWWIFPHVEAAESETPVVAWSKDYVKQNYQLVAAVEVGNDHAVYHWSPPFGEIDAANSGHVLIYQRKDLFGERK